MNDLTSDTYGDDGVVFVQTSGGVNVPAAAGHNNPPSTEAVIRQEHAALLARVEDLKTSAARVPAKIASDDDLNLASAFVAEARDVKREVEAAHKKAKEPYKEGADACDKVFLSKGACGVIDALAKSVKAAADAWLAEVERQKREAAAAEAKRAREEEEKRLAEAAALEEQGSHRVAEVLMNQAEGAAFDAEHYEAKAQASTADLTRTRTAAGVTVSGRTIWAGTITDAAKVDLNALRAVILEHELQTFVDRYVARGGRTLPGVEIAERVVSTWR